MDVSAEHLRSLTLAATEIAERAGTLITELYENGLHVREKEDATPVTEADERAEELILSGLAELTPDIPAIGEETAAKGAADARRHETFWLVDPIDGTRGFIQGSGEFTTNIALIRDCRPVLGVVAAPALGRLYRASGPGTGEKRQDGGGWTPIAARRPPQAGVVVVSSRSHGDREAIEGLLRGQRVQEHRHVHSSLKFCLIAEGAADIYPRYGATSEWDTAAGHAVLEGAGGSVRTSDGKPLEYGKADWLNPEFIARGRE